MDGTKLLCVGEEPLDKVLLGHCSSGLKQDCKTGDWRAPDGLSLLFLCQIDVLLCQISA